MLVMMNFAAYDYDVAVDKFDFAPVQSPDMRSTRCKKFLVQGDEPHKWIEHFVSGAKGAILGVKILKNEDKNRFAAYTCFKTCQTILQT